MTNALRVHALVAMRAVQSDREEVLGGRSVKSWKAAVTKSAAGDVAAAAAVGAADAEGAAAVVSRAARSAAVTARVRPVIRDLLGVDLMRIPIPTGGRPLRQDCNPAAPAPPRFWGRFRCQAHRTVPRTGGHDGGRQVASERNHPGRGSAMLRRAVGGAGVAGRRKVPVVLGVLGVALVLAACQPGTTQPRAGTGTSGTGGDAGPATKAQLEAPGEVLAIPGGGFWVADSAACVVRKVDAAGRHLPGGRHRDLWLHRLRRAGAVHADRAEDVVHLHGARAQRVRALHEPHAPDR